MIHNPHAGSCRNIEWNCPIVPTDAEKQSGLKNGLDSSRAAASPGSSPSETQYRSVLLPQAQCEALGQHQTLRGNVGRV